MENQELGGSRTSFTMLTNIFGYFGYIFVYGVPYTLYGVPALWAVVVGECV